MDDYILNVGKKKLFNTQGNFGFSIFGCLCRTKLLEYLENIVYRRVNYTVFFKNFM